MFNRIQIILPIFNVGTGAERLVELPFDSVLQLEHRNGAVVQRPAVVFVKIEGADFLPFIVTSHKFKC